jgi:small-conductance mechanosensitive channel
VALVLREDAMEFSTVTAWVDKVIQFQLFTINQTPVTLGSIVIFIAFFAAFIVVSRIMVHSVASRVFTRLKVDNSIQYTAERTLQYVLFVIGAIVALEFVGINLSGLAVIFGFLSVGIGFGLQNVTSNFISGIIVLFERPIRVGDRVTVGDTEGNVIAINLRSTTVRSINNVAIIVPNSAFISENVINWSHGDTRIRMDIDVGVSYNSDLETVLRCLQEVADDCSTVLDDPKPSVLHTGFGDSAWDMRLRCWVANPKGRPLIRSELNCAIVKKFRENGVEIPFPQRDLHVRSSVPLKTAV